MTLTVLASVSLFVLVSTARPLRRTEDELLAFHPPTNYNELVRTVLVSGAEDSGAVRECLECHDDVQILLGSVEEVQDYLSDVDETSVKALVHLEEQSFHSPDEKGLLDVLQRMDMEKGRHTPVSDEQIDKIFAMSLDNVSLEKPAESREPESSSIFQPNIAAEAGYSTSVVVISVSCIASLLALACVGVAIYVVQILKQNVMTSQLAWDLLPHLEKKPGGEDGPNNLQAEGRSLLVDVSDSEPGMVSEKAISWDGGLLSPHPLRKTISQTSIGTEKSDQDLDDKFYDVASSASSSPYSTPALHTSLLPPEDTNIEKSTEEHAAQRSLPTLTVPEMQEVDCFPGGFPSRPSWLVRASEAKLRKVEMDSDGFGVSAGRKSYGASPQFDAALAMQLRPGMGINADAAWLVRFVMAVFGWCAVLVSGRRD